MGKTKLVAKVGEQVVSVDVAVSGNPFADVKLKDKPEGNYQFSVLVTVQGQSCRRHRISPGSEGPRRAAWQPATRRDDAVSAELTSPKLPLTTIGATYHLVLNLASRERKWNAIRWHSV